MKHVLLALSCLLLLPLDGTKLVFAPQACSRVSKHFDFELEFSETAVTLDGTDMGDWIPTVRLTTSVGFEDKYTKTAGGRPIDLSRTFGKLSGKWFYGDVPEDILGFFALSDSTVEFEWDPKHENYAKSLTSGIVRGIALENLIEDADLRGLLPPEAVKLGSKWTSMGRPAMDALFGPTEMGMLGIPAATEDGLVRDIVLRPFRELGEKELSIECTYLGPSEDQANLVNTHLAIDQKLDLDITSEVNEYLRGSFGSTEIQLDLCRLTWEVMGPGTLIWDIDKGHFGGFSLSLKLDLTCELRLFAPSQTLLDIRLKSTGSAKWNYSAQQIE